MCLFAVIGERGLLAHFLFQHALVKKMIKALASKYFAVLLGFVFRVFIVWSKYTLCQHNY